MFGRHSLTDLFVRLPLSVNIAHRPTIRVICPRRLSSKSGLSVRQDQSAADFMAGRHEADAGKGEGGVYKDFVIMKFH